MKLNREIVILSVKSYRELENIQEERTVGKWHFKKIHPGEG